MCTFVYIYEHRTDGGDGHISLLKGVEKKKYLYIIYLYRIENKVKYCIYVAYQTRAGYGILLFVDCVE